jgi:hypothetical protein
MKRANPAATGNLSTTQRAALQSAGILLADTRLQVPERGLLLLRVIPVASRSSAESGPPLTPSQLKKLQAESAPKTAWFRRNLLARIPLAAWLSPSQSVTYPILRSAAFESSVRSTIGT